MLNCIVKFQRNLIFRHIFILLFASLLSRSVAFQLKLQTQLLNSSKTIFQQKYQNPADNQSKPQICSFNDHFQIPHQSQRACVWKQNICQQTYTQITHNKFDANFLVPGTLFQQVNPSTIDRGMKQFYVQNEFRNPFKVTISNGLRNIFQKMANPNEVKEKIYSMMQSQLTFLNSQPVELTIMEDDREIAKILEALGLSSSIYQQLYIARGSQYPLTPLKKNVIIFHQKLFTAAIELPSLSNKRYLFQSYFRDTSSVMFEKIKKQINDPDDPLKIITRTNYGRLLVVSLLYSQDTKNPAEDLTICSDQVPMSLSCVIKAMNPIIKNSNTRFYFAGIDETQPYQNNRQRTYGKPVLNWQKVFFDITPSSVRKLRPLSAEAMSLVGQPFVQRQLRYFETKECHYNLSIEVVKLGQGNTLKVIYDIPKRTPPSRPNRPKNNQKQLFNTTHPGTFQIGSEIGKELFQLKFIAKGKQVSNGYGFFFLKRTPVYSIQAEWILLINGERKFSHIIGNSRSYRQFMEKPYLVDMTQSIVTALLEK